MRVRPPSVFAIAGCAVLTLLVQACSVGPAPVAPTPNAATVTAAALSNEATARAAAALTPGSDPARTFAQPEQVVVAGKQYTATIKTDRGEIVLALNAAKAPRTVNSFVFLAKKGYFDGITFHRVEPGFVVQAGDPLGNGTGGPGYQFEEDQNDLSNVKWTLSMAKATGSTKVGSQFFINLADNTALDASVGTQKRFYPFATVVSGQDIVAALKRGDVMKSVVITEK